MPTSCKSRRVIWIQLYTIGIDYLHLALIYIDDRCYRPAGSSDRSSATSLQIENILALPKYLRHSRQQRDSDG